MAAHVADHEFQLRVPRMVAQVVSGARLVQDLSSQGFGFLLVVPETGVTKNNRGRSRARTDADMTT